jgi:hypothetical protein
MPTVPELRAMAKERDLKGTSKMVKAELEAALGLKVTGRPRKSPVSTSSVRVRAPNSASSAQVRDPSSASSAPPTTSFASKTPCQGKEGCGNKGKADENGIFRCHVHNGKGVTNEDFGIAVELAICRIRGLNEKGVNSSRCGS